MISLLSLTKSSHIAVDISVFESAFVKAKSGAALKMRDIASNPGSGVMQKSEKQMAE